jgi:hypothetical protein
MFNAANRDPSCCDSESIFGSIDDISGVSGTSVGCTGVAASLDSGVAVMEGGVGCTGVAASLDSGVAVMEGGASIMALFETSDSGTESASLTTAEIISASAVRS